MNQQVYQGHSILGNDQVQHNEAYHTNIYDIPESQHNVSMIQNVAYGMSTRSKYYMVDNSYFKTTIQPLS